MTCKNRVIYRQWGKRREEWFVSFLHEGDGGLLGNPKEKKSDLRAEKTTRRK